jgi:hypothetical protein
MAGAALAADGPHLHTRLPDLAIREDLRVQRTIHVHCFVVPYHARRHDDCLERGPLGRRAGRQHRRCDGGLLLGDLRLQWRFAVVKLRDDPLHACGRLGVELRQNRGELGGGQVRIFDPQGREDIEHRVHVWGVHRRS